MKTWPPDPRALAQPATMAVDDTLDDGQANRRASNSWTNAAGMTLNSLST